MSETSVTTKTTAVTESFRWYENVTDQWFDSAGNYHFVGEFSGEHIIRKDSVDST